MDNPGSASMNTIDYTGRSKSVNPSNKKKGTVIGQSPSGYLKKQKMTSRLGAYNTAMDQSYEQIKYQNDLKIKQKMDNLENLNKLQQQNDGLS